MDPDTAWATATDETMSMADRIDAVDALMMWFGNGGYEPLAYNDAKWKELKRMWLESQD